MAGAAKTKERARDIRHEFNEFVSRLWDEVMSAKTFSVENLRRYEEEALAARAIEVKGATPVKREDEKVLGELVFKRTSVKEARKINSHITEQGFVSAMALGEMFELASRRGSRRELDDKKWVGA